LSICNLNSLVVVDSIVLIVGQEVKTQEPGTKKNKEVSTFKAIVHQTYHINDT